MLKNCPWPTTAASLVVTFALLVWVVPSFERMFEDGGAALPVRTQVLLHVTRPPSAGILPSLFDGRLRRQELVQPRCRMLGEHCAPKVVTAA